MLDSTRTSIITTNGRIKKQFYIVDTGITMESRTQNIYFQPRYESNAQYEQNVVKHLITVLKTVDDSVTGFLFENLISGDWLMNSDEISSYNYDIEVSPPDDPDYEEAHVLGLSNYRTQIEDVEKDEKDARADGQINGVNKNGDQVFTIIIEAKTGSDTLSSEQLNRYEEEFVASSISTAEWSDIHGIFVELEVEDQVNEFLIDQYAEFLLNEEMEGVVAESEHTDGDGKTTQVNRILIRYEPSLEDEPYAIRFLSWHRDSADDDFVLYYSAWFSVEDFKSLFEQIDKDKRRETFVGDKNEEGTVKPTLDPLIEWAQNGGYGPSEEQDDFKGSHQKVFAEIKDRNEHYPELRLKGGDSLRFSRLTENKSPNIQRPTHYEAHEFTRLMLDLDEDLREAMFVDFDFDPLWDYYTRRI